MSQHEAQCEERWKTTFNRLMDIEDSIKQMESRLIMGAGSMILFLAGVIVTFINEMRRGREKDLDKYINVRIAQLQQDMAKAHDEYDKQWYNRIIQELCWVKSQQHNCYMQSGITSHRRK